MGAGCAGRRAPAWPDGPQGGPQGRPSAVARSRSGLGVGGVGPADDRAHGTPAEVDRSPPASRGWLTAGGQGPARAWPNRIPAQTDKWALRRMARQEGGPAAAGTPLAEQRSGAVDHGSKAAWRARRGRAMSHNGLNARCFDPFGQMRPRPRCGAADTGLDRRRLRRGECGRRPETRRRCGVDHTGRKGGRDRDAAGARAPGGGDAASPVPGATGRGGAGVGDRRQPGGDPGRAGAARRSGPWPDRAERRAIGSGSRRRGLARARRGRRGRSGGRGGVVRIGRADGHRTRPSVADTLRNIFL